MSTFGMLNVKKSQTCPNNSKPSSKERSQGPKTRLYGSENLVLMILVERGLLSNSLLC